MGLGGFRDVVKSQTCGYSSSWIPSGAHELIVQKWEYLPREYGGSFVNLDYYKRQVHIFFRVGYCASLHV